jgi:hypothetical protein
MLKRIKSSKIKGNIGVGIKSIITNKSIKINIGVGIERLINSKSIKIKNNPIKIPYKNS